MCSSKHQQTKEYSISVLNCPLVHSARACQLTTQAGKQKCVTPFDRGACSDAGKGRRVHMVFLAAPSLQPRSFLKGRNPNTFISKATWRHEKRTQTFSVDTTRWHPRYADTCDNCLDCYYHEAASTSRGMSTRVSTLLLVSIPTANKARQHPSDAQREAIAMNTV